MGWTAPRTWTNGEVPTAAHFNTHVRDNMEYLKDTYFATAHDASAHTDCTRTFIVRCSDRGDDGATSWWYTDYARFEDAVHYHYILSNIVPHDLVSFVSIKWLVWARASGDAYLRASCCYAGDGEVHTTNQDTASWGAVTLTGQSNPIIVYPVSLSDEPDLSGLAADDLLGLYFERDATHGSDTISEIVGLYGAIITYTANQ